MMSSRREFFGRIWIEGEEGGGEGYRLFLCDARLIIFFPSSFLDGRFEIFEICEKKLRSICISCVWDVKFSKFIKVNVYIFNL